MLCDTHLGCSPAWEPSEGLPGALVLQLRLGVFDSASPGPQVVLSHRCCQCEACSVHTRHLFLLLHTLYLCLEQGMSLQADQL